MLKSKENKPETDKKKSKKPLNGNSKPEASGFSAFWNKLNARLSQPIGGKKKNGAQISQNDESIQMPGNTSNDSSSLQEAVSQQGLEKVKSDLHDTEIPEVHNEYPVEMNTGIPEKNTVEEEPPSDILEKESSIADTGEETIASQETSVPKSPARNESVSDISKTDMEALYTGDIELSITSPLNLSAMFKLYNYLQSTPDVKVLFTRGAWNKNNTIMISLDKPLPIIGMITKIPGISVFIKSITRNISVNGNSALLRGTRKEDIKRMVLVLQESG
jgi:hypothetical protein